MRVTEAGQWFWLAPVNETIAIDLILKGMTDLMRDRRPYWLTRRRVDPKRADHVVVARACREPFLLPEKIDLHPITFESALPFATEPESADVRLIRSFRLREQVVDVHAHFLGRFRAVGIGAKAGFPENNEMFALTGTLETPT